MCLAVYIASDQELPLIAWSEESPKFYVCEISNEETKVSQQFSLPCIAYVGSHQGCGCGFFKEGLKKDELILVQANYTALSYYLSSLRLKGAKLAIFSCWEGEQGKEPNSKEHVSLNHLASAEFEFKENVYYEIT